MITQHSHMSSKTTIISNLLQRESSIQPTAEVTATQMPQGVAVNDDGPTMLELMMAAQEQARNTKTLESKELGNSFGGGFKKGFLGKSPAISKAAKSIETKQKPKCTDISQQTSVGEIIDVTATITLEKRDQSRHHAPVLDEVQEAMAEDDNPFLAKLKKGDWANEKLLRLLESNKVVATGLRDPTCVAALEAMQTDPQKARARYAGDAHVTRFLQEFGRVMSSHFTDLHEQQQQQQQSGSSVCTTQDPSGVGVQEIGPLHAEVLKRNNYGVANSSSGGGMMGGDKEEQRAHALLQDPAVRALLLDPDTQRLLQDCADPVRLQAHLRNPASAAKIQQLLNLGLLRVAT